jgi:hypothetical protein
MLEPKPKRAHWMRDRVHQPAVTRFAARQNRGRATIGR